MADAQINPLLIHHLTKKTKNEIPAFPTISWLTGEYAELIDAQKDKLPRQFDENIFTLTCRSCDHKEKYDVGLMVVNPEIKNAKDKDRADSIQTTGYFR